MTSLLKNVYPLPSNISLSQSQALLTYGHSFLSAPAPGGNLTLDLSQVTMVNSITLGAMVALHHKFQEKGRRVLIAHAGPEVMETLRAVGLDALLFVEGAEAVIDTLGAEVDISLKIGFEVYKNIGIFTFSGSMVAPRDSRLFLKMAQKILTDGFRMLLDMGGMAFIDSQGVAAIASLYKSMSAHQGEIRLCSAGEIIQDLLRVHQLLDFIRVYPDRDRALEGWT